MAIHVRQTTGTLSLGKAARPTGEAVTAIELPHSFTIHCVPKYPVGIANGHCFDLWWDRRLKIGNTKRSMAAIDKCLNGRVVNVRSR